MRSTIWAASAALWDGYAESLERPLMHVLRPFEFRHISPTTIVLPQPPQSSVGSAAYHFLFCNFLPRSNNAVRRLSRRFALKHVQISWSSPIVRHADTGTELTRSRCKPDPYE
ncbi:hypothetical protein L226DRAFT_40130 [Lentinus tigrinus ALCF2SS1-7]|uniref:uncharacterized protein n=1 Tax=Lentinus tigrinus ALCF2SS1-7 TaxID=1328758 RepID=UPI0011660F66|nr:hypothetical protein L226DRAFT_40130 [Lentinus tigrinus ALCF2SS1-7]